MRARQLEIFCAIMRAGTITAAARALNVSQPALSQILLHTEDELGFKLFTRIKGRLHATPEADDLYPQAARLFGELEALRRKAADMRHGRTGLVRFAGSGPPSISIVPQALASFRAAHPDILVRSHIAPIETLTRMLCDGDAGLAMAMNDMPQPDIDVEVQGHVGMVCVFPEGHMLADAPEITFDTLADQVLISYRQDTRPAQELTRVAHAQGHQYAPAIEIDMSISALAFVQQGLGVALVDGLLPWQQFKGVQARSFAPQIRLPVVILTHRDRPMSRPDQLLRDHLRRACATVLDGGTGV